jgi:hypothetical protein
VFYVSLLEPWQRRKGKEPSPTTPIVVKGKQEWEIEAIIKEQTYQKKHQYLAKWLRYPSYKNQWINKDKLGRAQELLDKFRARES